MPRRRVVIICRLGYCVLDALRQALNSTALAVLEREGRDARRKRNAARNCSAVLVLCVIRLGNLCIAERHFEGKYSIVIAVHLAYDGLADLEVTLLARVRKRRGLGASGDRTSIFRALSRHTCDRSFANHVFETLGKAAEGLGHTRCRLFAGKSKRSDALVELDARVLLVHAFVGNKLVPIGMSELDRECILPSLVGIQVADHLLGNGQLSCLARVCERRLGFGATDGA